MIDETFSVTINRERAEAILCTEEACQSEGVGADLTFFFSGILHAFPDLTEGQYAHLFKETSWIRSKP